MAAKAAAKGFRKGAEKKVYHGILRTYIPAGMASGSPPLGTQLGQVFFITTIIIPTFFIKFGGKLIYLV